MKIRHLHLYASKISNFIAYILAFKFISSVDSQTAYFIAAAIIIKFIADEMYFYELMKEEKDLIAEFDKAMKQMDKKE